MRYLKCHHCSNFNEINSEYQIFCNACGKKLDNNFKDWQKQHPTKNVNDFRQEVGIEKATSKKKSKVSIQKMVQLVLIALFVVIGSYFGKQYSNQFFSFVYQTIYPISDALNKPWERQFFLGNKVSIECPYQLSQNKNHEQEGAKEVEGLLDAIYMYEYETFGGFAAAVVITEYNQKVVKVNLQGASHGFMVGVVDELEGVDVFYNDEKTSIHHHPTIVRKGTFRKDKDTYHFKNVTCLKDDLTTINLATIWINQNKDYDLLTDRMINSLMVE
ncbi:hypothetical protein ACXGQW_05105 [Wenyingzhuangia sp. IMCC45533]